MPGAEVAAPPVHTVLGRKVEFPVCVRDASSGAATFLVDAAAARRLVPDFLEPVLAAPGRALFSLAVVDYRDNDLGDYKEVSVAFFVRPRGARRGLPWLGAWLDLARGRLSTYIHRLPVDQEFTCEAGRRLWGFPKTLDEIRLERTRERCTCSWSKEGRQVLALSLPCGGRGRLREREMTTFTRLGGAPHVTRFSSAAEGVGMRLGGARLELGPHPVADELRGLGLPRPAVFTTWMERMHGRFEPPRALERGFS
jgi:hypothetical protein